MNQEAILRGFLKRAVEFDKQEKAKKKESKKELSKFEEYGYPTAQFGMGLYLINKAHSMATGSE